MHLYAPISCALPRDPRMIAAGPIARLVYIEAVLYCRENLTDGAIDRIALRHWGVDIRGKDRHLDRLADLGALERCTNGWRIPTDVYVSWNPTRSEVEAKRERERERKASYRKKAQAEASSPPDVPSGQDWTCPTPREQPKPKPEPEPEIRDSLALTAKPDPVDEREKLIEQTVTDLLTRRATPPDNERAWRTAVTRDLRTQLAYGLPLDRITTANPVPWCTPACELCDGNGWLPGDNGDRPTPCPNRLEETS